jgi:SAM-dependent methyltransferase
VCDSRLHDLLYEQRFEAFAAGSITDAYDVVACRQCGMCFASGLPDAERFEEYYEQSSKYDLSAEGAEVPAAEVERHHSEAAFIATAVDDRSRPILDIGTATGAFLVAMRDHGFTSVHGVEPSQEAARRARADRGLDVIAGEAAAAKAWGHPFAVVSLIAVLEHVVDAAAVVREAVQLLEPDGLVYVLVPDAARFSEYLDAPYQQFSVEHINYFTTGSLTNLFAGAGLDIVRQRATVVGHSADSDGPAIEVLGRRTAHAPVMAHDRRGVEALRRYVALSAEKEAGILRTIARLADDQTPIYVWGTGTHALHLLAVSRLGDCNIVAFIDSNPHYAGKQLAGREVMGPRDVGAVEAPILVASAVSQSAIAAAARATFGAETPLLLMY